MTIGAAKVLTNVGPEWCHFSRRGETLKFRRIVEQEVFEFAADESDVEEWMSLAQCQKMLPNQKLGSIKDVANWSRLLAKLDQGVHRKVGKQKSTGTQIVVPITRLRRYYNSMKIFEKALFEGLAAFYEKKPKLMEKLWNDSRRQFETYRNSEGWDSTSRKKISVFKKKLTDVEDTNQFTSYFKQNGLADSNFIYVERELNPWNTRKGMFSKKQPATRTGRGGMDLLLRSSDNVPVIGEVKVKNDKNAFFALIQAMTYAVELSTQNQTQRLKSNIEEFEKLDPTTPSVEIAIILVNPIDDKTIQPVIKLIRKLNQESKCVGLRKISLFKNKGEEWISHC